MGTPKYEIKKILFSRYFEKENLISEILRTVKCSRSTLYRWWAIENDSRESIPADALRDIAKVLGKNMEDMYSNQTFEPCQKN